MAGYWSRRAVFNTAVFVVFSFVFLNFSMMRGAFWGFTGSIAYHFTAEAAVRRAQEAGDFKTLKKYLSHRNDYVRFFAILGLEDLSTSGAEQSLRAWLPYESCEYNQVSLIRAILRMTSRDDRDDLIALLFRSVGSPNTNVRRLAQSSLDKVGAKRPGMDGQVPEPEEAP